MKKLMRRCLALLMMLFVSLAQAQTPTDESLDMYFEVTNMQAAYDVALSRDVVDDMFKRVINAIGYRLNEQQLTIWSQAAQESKKIWNDAINWESFEPAIREYIKKLYTQEEIDALIAFYQTPVGRSIAAKIPRNVEFSDKLMFYKNKEVIDKILEIQAQAYEKMGAAAN